MRALILSALTALTLSSQALAGDLSVVVRNAAGQPVKDAVVTLKPASGGVAGAPIRFTWPYSVAQQNISFNPFVLIVPAGSNVTFPNKDNVRHHVYSFSPAKKFELPLYKGTPAAPVLFDKPGVVVLGCNIHDWMLGYVLVLETPWFATTGPDGAAQLKDLPAGAYEVRVWHPRMPDGEPPRQRVTLATGKTETVEFQIALKPEWRPRRAPTGAGDRYR